MRAVLTIVGPTASGKTELALRLAEQLNAEIVSADSRQIYKYLDIGTAKPTWPQRQKAPFHLIDFLEPDQTYSCGQFSQDAQKKIEEIMRRGRPPIVCGGTGLYLRALFEPLHRLPRSTAESKQKIIAELEAVGLEKMFHRLREIDPAWADKVGGRDRQRILRGLEIYNLTGRPISEFLSGSRPAPKFQPQYFGLCLPRPILYQRIDQRFDRMVEQGLLVEVKSVLQRGYAPDCSGLRTIGYQEIIAYFQGWLTQAEAFALAKKNTRNFARRQETWFRKMKGINWLDGQKPIEELVKEVLN